MAKRLWLVLALGLALIGAQPALADVWDVATNNDNAANTTENDLVHGSDQLHDLADTTAGSVADQDWYTVGEAGSSSYEVVVDGTTGDLGNITITRTDSTGGTTLGSGSPIGVGYSQHLAWDNTTGAANNAIRVTDTECGGVVNTCDAQDSYRIRFYDTTCAIPRFNNSATQVTILIIQNTTSQTVNGHFYLWNGVTGALVNTTPANQTFALGPNAARVQNTSQAGFGPGVSGSVTVTNDLGYGAVAGKAVALEAATGFTFDTAMSCRPH
jgi:hypothetical protein